MHKVQTWLPALQSKLGCQSISNHITNRWFSGRWPITSLFSKSTGDWLVTVHLLFSSQTVICVVMFSCPSDTNVAFYESDHRKREWGNKDEISIKIWIVWTLKMKSNLNANEVTEQTDDLEDVDTAAFQETRYEERNFVKANLST